MPVLIFHGRIFECSILNHRSINAQAAPHTRKPFDQPIKNRSCLSIRGNRSKTKSLIFFAWNKLVLSLDAYWKYFCNPSHHLKETYQNKQRMIKPQDHPSDTLSMRSGRTVKIYCSISLVTFFHILQHLAEASTLQRHISAKCCVFLTRQNDLMLSVTHSMQPWISSILPFIILDLKHFLSIILKIALHFFYSNYYSFNEYGYRNWYTHFPERLWHYNQNTSNYNFQRDPYSN